ncbi:hypothetical protein CLAFUW4_00281 [Fulvia fulva]|uniref:Uncharacterized protein n=1 Tax=Passalora fulva TaxID=5499 RepID=A0A9Q8P2E4_PASFU|nr:uncharacterized protein CLAFUR5_00282 [Fulvia fulva]KAK4634714.1 hypothetical protein CLAFUR4_00281 [Fulvia fulva]KAK4637288.1 hypothetical protein CLAFUR0_00282 [Fulvia fulva]UJO10903.1 hypothetical protein CLAFUR5_00282 [Fulvia fulva]WPV10320.1 hypothetical protein CLAFUW4_00281 [Fulvia fulva]WPV24485.1 hypothetical protein CLAFUW7_00285 [Fulvia fulva]
MKTNNSVLFGLIASASTAVAQIVNCDGNQSPDWDDCDTIFSINRPLVEEIPSFYPDCTAYPVPAGVDPDTLNCQVRWCPTSAESRTSYSSTGGDYNLISINCKPAGGGADGIRDTYRLEVTNNPAYEPSSKRKGRRALAEAVKDKRQAESDTGFTLVTSSRSVERDGFQITGGLTAGSMYTVQQTDGKSTSTTVSASVGAGFFEFFSASVGTEVTSETSQENTVGITVNIPCDSDQRGQVFWYPLYDVYSGFTTPSNTNVEVVVPQQNDVSASNYRVKCIN